MVEYSYHSKLDPSWRSELMKAHPEYFTKTGEYRGPESEIRKYKSYEVVASEGIGKPRGVVRTGAGPATLSMPRGTGSGSQNPTFTEGPRIERPENLSEAALRYHTQSGSAYGKSPPQSFKAPKSQFRTSEGVTSRKTNLTRNVASAELSQSLSYRQQASKEGRTYFTNVQAAVMESPSRRIEREQRQKASTIQTYKIKAGKILDTGKLTIQPGPLDPKGKSQTSFANYITPLEKGEKSVTVESKPISVTDKLQTTITEKVKPYYERLGPKQKQAIKGAYAGIKVVGYGVGVPFKFGGKILQKVGSKIEPYDQQRKTVKVFGKQMYLQPQGPGKVVSNVGKFTEGFGTEYIERPGRALGTTAVFAGLSYVLSPVAIAGRSVASKIPLKVIPTAVRQRTGQVIATGLFGIYSYTAAKRIKASPEPYKKAGSIVAGEVIPMVAGAKIGSTAWIKSQGFVRSLKGKQQVPIESLTPKEVLEGRKNFPTAPQKTHIKLFKQGKYAIPGQPIKLKSKVKAVTYANLLQKEGKIHFALVNPKKYSDFTPETRGVFYHRTLKTGKPGIAISKYLKGKQLQVTTSHELVHYKQARTTIGKLIYVSEKKIPYWYKPSEVLARTFQTHKPVYKATAVFKGKGFYYPHATPALFGKKFTTISGERTKEAAGLFVSGKGASTYFLRIGDQPAGVYPSKLFPGAETPTLIYVKPSGVQPLPKSLRKGYGTSTKAFKWFETKATKGVAYVPAIKTEVEAVIPPGSQFKLTSKQFYTRYKGVDVPIRQYDLAAPTKVELFYPVEDIVARTGKIPKYYYPPSKVSPSGVSYGLMSLKYSGVGKPSSSVVSKSSYSVIASSYTPPSRVSSYVSKISSSVYSKYSKVSSSEYSPSSIISGGSSSYSIISPPYSPTPNPPTPPYTPPYVPPSVPPYSPPPPPFKFDDWRVLGKTSPSKLFTKRPYRKQASVAGIIKGLKGKGSKKKYTGLEIRPIPIR